MKKETTRIILFVTAVPAIIGIILFLPFKNFLVINILFIAIAVGSSLEAGKLVLKRSAPLIRYLAAAFTGLICTWVFIDTAGFLPRRFPAENVGIAIFVVFTVVLFFISMRVPSKTEISSILGRTGAAAFLLLYPSLFFIFCIKLTGLKYPAFLLLFLILIIFLSDAVAYAAGKLFGKKNRVVTELSPNKTAVGFITEILFCAGAAALIAVFFPLRFPLHPAWAALFGIGLGIASIIGDLFESALKRSSGVKDSGRVVPGRGGFLDSLDSLLFSAPLFYFIIAGL